MSNATKKCEFCDKRGVPILPIRYAVAPAGASLPRASGPSIPLPDGAAYYTRRLLRSGYLYVYDEARKRWDAYFVTPQSLFFKITSTPGVIPITPKKPFDCPDQGHRAVASCITIPDAKNATKVWLGFSDVQWTKEVMDRHESEAYRKKHMRCVDVKAFAASADAAHVTGIHTSGKLIAEYHQDKASLQKSLGWGPFEVDPRMDQLNRLIRESENLAPGKGFAVALEDPAAIAAELDALMNRNLQLFNDAPDRKRKLAVSAAIEKIEAAVREQARVDREQAAERNAAHAMAQPDLGVLFSKSYAKQQTERYERLSSVTEAEARAAGDRAWIAYRDKFDANAMANWNATYAKELQAYDEKFIAPLAQAHAGWMKSEAMLAQFECNYDVKDPKSGIVFPKTLQLCIGSTQDKAACFDVYSTWLAGDVSDKKNLLLSAMTLNLDKTREEIQKAMQVSLDWRGFPFDALMGGFGAATESVAQGKADAVGKLLTQVFGPLTKLMNTAIDGKVRAGLVAVGLYTQKTFAVVDVAGKSGDFRAALIRDIIKLSGQPLNENKVKHAVRMELKRLGMMGMDLSKPENKKFLVMVDPDHLKSMPPNLTRAQQSAWVVQAIKTSAQFEELQLANMNKWQSQVRNPVNKVVKGSVPYVTALVVAALQLQAYNKLGEDEGKAMKHEKSEAQHRLRAGTLALIGTITEAVGNGVDKLVQYVPKAGQGFANMTGRVLVWVGKGLGIAGAVIMAAMDVNQAISMFSEKRYGLGIAYVFSAGFGIGAAWFLGFSSLAAATGIGLILVVLAIGVALLIEFFKDNKVQDWLERCIWGKGPDPQFKTLEDEMQELKVATAG
ncbi:MAG: T6SS effector BTH_I2691 family protein [Aquabacterium sp.]